MTPKEEWIEARVQEAVAIVEAKRKLEGTNQWVDSQAPVEEFMIRGRRILVKRDDKASFPPYPSPLLLAEEIVSTSGDK